MINTGLRGRTRERRERDHAGGARPRVPASEHVKGAGGAKLPGEK